jgi:hypothetical protein
LTNINLAAVLLRLKQAVSAWRSLETHEGILLTDLGKDATTGKGVLNYLSGEELFHSPIGMGDP